MSQVAIELSIGYNCQRNGKLARNILNHSEFKQGEVQMKKKLLVLAVVVLALAVVFLLLRTFAGVELGPVQGAQAATLHQEETECFMHEVVPGYQEMLPPDGIICATMFITQSGNISVQSGWAITVPLTLVTNQLITRTYPTTDTGELAPQLLPQVLEVEAGDEVTWIPTDPGSGTSLGVRFTFAPTQTPQGCKTDVIVPGDTYKQWNWDPDTLAEDLCVAVTFEVPGELHILDGAVLHAPVSDETGEVISTTAPIPPEIADRIVPFDVVITDTTTITKEFHVSPGVDGSAELKLWFTFEVPRDPQGCQTFEFSATEQQLVKTFNWAAGTHPDDYCVTFTYSNSVGTVGFDSGWVYQAPVWDTLNGDWDVEYANDGTSADQILKTQVVFPGPDASVTVYVTPTENGTAELGLRYTAVDVVYSNIYLPLIEK